MCNLSFREYTPPRGVFRPRNLFLPNAQRPKINLRAEQPKDAQASLSRSALSFTTGFACRRALPRWFHLSGDVLKWTQRHAGRAAALLSD